MRLLTCITLCLVFNLTHAVENMGRLYINPFNGNALDLWILIQEDAGFLNELGYSQVQTTLERIFDKFSSLGSGARFSVGFYGANNQTRWAVPPGTSTSTSAKLSFNRFRYLGRNSLVNSTSVLALKDVIAACNSTTCRNNVPRVLLMIGNKFNEILQDCNYTVTTTISNGTAVDPPSTTDPHCTDLNRTLSGTLRELEREKLFTVMIVAVNYTDVPLSELVSEPHGRFGISITTLSELVTMEAYLANKIAEVSRFVDQGTRLTFPNAQVNQDNFMMVNVGDVTSNENGMAALTLRCRKCNVFASSNNPRPTRETGSILQAMHNVTGLGDTSMYYVQVKQGATRLYINVEILMTGTTEAWVSVFPLPDESSSKTYKKMRRSYFHE